MRHLQLGRRLLGLAVSAWVLVAGDPPAVAEPDQAAQAEITALLTAVGASGCTFIRNGEPGDAAGARAHLERKYRYARKKLDSAETFIERVASQSSTTGRPYLVECRGEPQERAREWLFARLAEIRGP
jgi:hypothetical protein